MYECRYMCVDTHTHSHVICVLSHSASILNSKVGFPDAHPASLPPAPLPPKVLDASWCLLREPSHQELSWVDKTVSWRERTLGELGRWTWQGHSLGRERHGAVTELEHLHTHACVCVCFVCVCAVVGERLQLLWCSWRPKCKEVSSSK